VGKGRQSLQLQREHQRLLKGVKPHLGSVIHLSPSAQGEQGYAVPHPATQYGIVANVVL